MSGRNGRTPDPTDPTFYEGLIRETAWLNLRYWDDDYEDLCQFFRIKVWRALKSYDATKSRVPLRNYVFSCVYNGVKDVRKKARRSEVSLEEQSRVRSDSDDDFMGSAFEARYLSTGAEDVYEQVLRGGIEDADELPELPSTLTTPEAEVVRLLYLDYSRPLIATMLGVEPKEVTRLLNEVRQKMADWRPTQPSSPPEGASQPQTQVAA